tara:strand:- start:470 stop:748 length:279 start_codon:yes stop_codon:yes gene_type:complete
MVDKKVYNRKELDEILEVHRCFYNFLDEIAQIQSNEEPVRLYEEDIDRHRQAIADSKNWFDDDDDEVNISVTEHNKAVLKEVERLKKIWGRN